MAIYMITGWSEEFTSSGTRPVTVDGVLGKPLSVDELRSIVGEVARRRAPNAAQVSADRADS
jgi:DNA-binding response OmpR family regulator